MEKVQVIEVPKLKDLENLLTPYMNGCQLQSYKTRYLTKPGDHYGSCMIAVSVKTLTTSGNEEILEMVAKIPPLSDFYFELFNPERTFRSENSVYLDFVPALKALEEGLNISEDLKFSKLFPKCYGGRVNCTSEANPVDRDALLILENIVTLNFEPPDRSKFFCLEDCEFVLKNLAKFHAASIVLKRLKPVQFKEIVSRHFKKYNEHMDKVDKEVIKSVEKAVNHNKELIEKYIKYFDLTIADSADGKECPDGLYTAICHFDFWINNMMIKYDTNRSKPVDIKIVDFQLAQYNSAARDVLFFLFTSAEFHVLRKNFQDLLRVYFDNLVSFIEAYGCSSNEYSFESFLNEVTLTAPLEIHRTMILLKVIMSDVKIETNDFSKLGVEVFQDENENELDNLSCHRRIQESLELFEKFGFFK